MPDTKTPSTLGHTAAQPLGLTPSFGFGDRLGFATPGHLASLQQAGGPIAGIFAQQSIREMARTQRTATDVMTAARQALSQDAEAPAVWGADADHLKTPEDVRVTAEAGFVFFTIDPSDHVDQKADGYSAAQIEEKYQPAGWESDYLGRTINVPNGPSIEFDELTVKRAVVKYGKAISFGLELAEHIRKTAAELDQPYEIEVSVDETDQPTTIAEHYIIADQLIRGRSDANGLGRKLVSLAPRFIGELEKGIDYIGDVAALEQSLQQHAAIAAHLGPYKLSLHSGSDKLSMYGALGRATQGQFHVKTAGTSYLEALRVVAMHDPELFSRIIDFSRDHYDHDRATYHVHATLDSAPPTAEADHDRLVSEYLENWSDVPAGKGFTKPGRQILHCTFGSVMTDAELAPLVRQILTEHPGSYRDVLADHFSRHLIALNGG